MQNNDLLDRMAHPDFLNRMAHADLLMQAGRDFEADAIYAELEAEAEAASYAQRRSVLRLVYSADPRSKS